MKCDLIAAAVKGCSKSFGLELRFNDDRQLMNMRELLLGPGTLDIISSVSGARLESLERKEWCCRSVDVQVEMQLGRGLKI